MDGLWWCAERFGRVSFHFVFLQLFALGYSASGETARWISHKCEMELQLVLSHDARFEGMYAYEYVLYCEIIACAVHDVPC